MKSPQIEAAPYIADKTPYSDLQVMRSAAGFYVGTVKHEDGCDVPGSRDTGYFPSRGQADAALALMRAGKLRGRMEP